MPIKKELNSQKLLQKTFIFETFLVYYNLNRVFYIDLDTFKKYNIGAIIYHIKKDFNRNIFNRSDIQPIFFFLKLLNKTEICYWLIKFEIAGLVQIIKKINYFLVYKIKNKIIIFIDYIFIINIVKSINLILFFLNKLNFRFMWAL